jgi:cation/acetate symporter
LIETVNEKTILLPAWFTKWETTGLLTFEDKMAMENSILQRQLKDAAFLAAQEAKGNKGRN